MAILALTQKAMKNRRRFTWNDYSGSIYVTDEGGGWIGVSGKLLVDLATQILGEPDGNARNGLDQTYTTWSNTTTYQLADILFQADNAIGK